MQTRKYDTFEQNHYLSTILQAHKDGQLPDGLQVHQHGQEPFMVYRGPADWNKESGVWPQPEKPMSLPDSFGFPMPVGDFLNIKAELEAKAGIRIKVDESYNYTIPTEHRVSDTPEGEGQVSRPEVDLTKMNQFEREDYLARQKQ